VDLEGWDVENVELRVRGLVKRIRIFRDLPTSPGFLKRLKVAAMFFFLLIKLMDGHKLLWKELER